MVYVCGACVCKCRCVSVCGPGQSAGSSQQRRRVDGVPHPLGPDGSLAGPQHLALRIPLLEVEVHLLVQLLELLGGRRVLGCRPVRRRPRPRRAAEEPRQLLEDLHFSLLSSFFLIS